MNIPSAVRRANRLFRFRLSCVRALQLRVAEEKKRIQAQEWNNYLQDLKDWRQYCDDITCPHCGQRKQPLGLCCKDVPIIRTFVTMLRKLAGLCPQPRVCMRTEWIDWRNGSSGAHACGPSAWDNAVRAVEDG